MRVIYNGVDLMPLETHYFDMEPVYDDHGVDYLYTKVSLAVRSMVNGIASIVPVGKGPPIPGGASVLSSGPPMNYIFDSPTSSAGTVTNPTARSNPRTVPKEPTRNVTQDADIHAEDKSKLRGIILNPLGVGYNPTDNTHTAIRHRLSVPQGKLYVFWGRGMEGGIPAAGTFDPPQGATFPNGGTVARLFIESPSGSSRVDCKNGPFPKIFSVVNALGDANTLIVDWGVETYINESSLNEVSRSGALLSNRFSQVHEVDEFGFTRITTTGVAIFRTDFIYSSPWSPDYYRQYLFMPILNYFKRKILYVRGREDVTGVEYSYQDTQVSENFVAGPFVKAADIKILHRQAVTSNPDFFGSALAAYERTLNILVNKKWSKADHTETPGPAIHKWKPGTMPPPPGEVHNPS